MCSINQDIFLIWSWLDVHFILDTALKNYNSFSFIPFYGVKKERWESLKLSFEHLSRADVESEDNKKAAIQRSRANLISQL